MTRLSHRIVVVAQLLVVPDGEEEFVEFETKATRVMSRYGGAIERRIALHRDEDSTEPSEIHIVSFPDRDSFESYKRDPELESLRPLRMRAIRETVLWLGEDLPPFPG